jgi:hypothetical protein
VRLWYGFFEATMASEGAFEGKMEELCRELGDKGKALATVQLMESAVSATAACASPEELLPLLQGSKALKGFLL